MEHNRVNTLIRHVEYLIYNFDNATTQDKTGCNNKQKSKNTATMDLETNLINVSKYFNTDTEQTIEFYIAQWFWNYLAFTNRKCNSESNKIYDLVNNEQGRLHFRIVNICIIIVLLTENSAKFNLEPHQKNILIGELYNLVYEFGQFNYCTGVTGCEKLQTKVRCLTSHPNPKCRWKENRGNTNIYMEEARRAVTLAPPSPSTPPPSGPSPSSPSLSGSRTLPLWSRRASTRRRSRSSRRRTHMNALKRAAEAEEARRAWAEAVKNERNEAQNVIENLNENALSAIQGMNEALRAKEKAEAALAAKAGKGQDAEKKAKKALDEKDAELKKLAIELSSAQAAFTEEQELMTKKNEELARLAEEMKMRRARETDDRGTMTSARTTSVGVVSGSPAASPTASSVASPNPTPPPSPVVPVLNLDVLSNTKFSTDEYYKIALCQVLLNTLIECDHAQAGKSGVDTAANAPTEKPNLRDINLNQYFTHFSAPHCPSNCKEHDLPGGQLDEKLRACGRLNIKRLDDQLRPRADRQKKITITQENLRKERVDVWIKILGEIKFPLEYSKWSSEFFKLLFRHYYTINPNDNSLMGDKSLLMYRLFLGEESGTVASLDFAAKKFLASEFAKRLYTIDPIRDAVYRPDFKKELLDSVNVQLPYEYTKTASIILQHLELRLRYIYWQLYSENIPIHELCMKAGILDSKNKISDTIIELYINFLIENKMQSDPSMLEHLRGVINWGSIQKGGTKTKKGKTKTKKGKTKTKKGKTKTKKGKTKKGKTKTKKGKTKKLN